MRKQTQLLLALFVGLAAASVMAITKQPERGMVRLDLSHTDLSRVDAIVLATDPTVALTKRNDSWYLPNGHRADDTLVQGLLRELGEVNSSDFITEDFARFTDLNVEGPRANAVTLRRRGRDVVTITVGEGTSPGQNYVRQNDRVFRVQGLMLAAHGRAPEDWEDRTLHHDAAENVRHIAIAVKGQQAVTLIKDDAGWQPAPDATLPKNFRFDGGQVHTLINGLAHLRAAQLIDVDPGEATTHLTEATADAITWTLDDNAPGEAGGAQRRLCVGGAASETTRYVRMAGHPQLYTVDNQQLHSILRSWASLRTLTMMAPIETSDVVSITVTPPSGTPLPMKRSVEGDWAPSTLSKGKKPMALDPIKVRQRINQVALARAITYVGEPAKHYGIGVSKTGRVRLVTAQGKSHTLTFGRALRPEEGVGFYAQGDADSSIYTVSLPLHQNLLGGAQSLQRVLPKTASDPANLAGVQGLTPEMEAQIRKQLAQSGQG